MGGYVGGWVGGCNLGWMQDRVGGYVGERVCKYENRVILRGMRGCVNMRIECVNMRIL